MSGCRSPIAEESSPPREAPHTFVRSAGSETSKRERTHPSHNGAIFCASPGGGYKPTGEFPSSIPHTYLVGGTEERFFLRNATRWANALRDAGADVVIMERVGSHGGAFWVEEFPLMVAWAFGR